jgi:tetratricopeptide (TPR) repeat protein
MIPRWRGLRQTPSMELVSSPSKRKSFQTVAHAEGVIREWLDSPSPWSAADVIAMSFIEGRSTHSDQAALYLRRVIAQLAPGVRHLLLSYEDPRSGAISPAGIQTSAQVKWRHIAELKSEIRVYPRNAVLYVDLARAHVSLGQTHPAKKAFEIALALAPFSRYVIRCAVRFFVFEGELDRAWSVLKNVAKDDPWLTACKVAVADLAQRPQESLRSTRRIIDDGDASQITELAAAVATLELEAGSNKIAKKLFKRGAENPSDNTVAQIRWAHETAGIPFDQKLLNTELSFEARTGQAIEEQDWATATHNASIWLGDEPFSTRAASLGAFVAAEMLQNFESAEGIATRGLIVSPHDAILLNNRAYSRSCLGNIYGAREDLKNAQSVAVDETDRICLLATEGCIEYRSGDTISGSKLYRSAIERGMTAAHKEYSQRALIHWIGEDGLLGRRLPQESAENIINFFSNPKKISRETRAVFEIHALPFLTGTSLSLEDSDLLGVCDSFLPSL